MSYHIVILLLKEMGEVRKISNTSMSTYLENILSKVLHNELLCDKGDRKTVEPIEFVQPEVLENIFGSLTIGQEPTSDERLDAIVDNVIRYSVKTSSLRFHNQVIRSSLLLFIFLGIKIDSDLHQIEITLLFLALPWRR